MHDLLLQVADTIRSRFRLASHIYYLLWMTMEGHANLNYLVKIPVSARLSLIFSTFRLT